MAKVHQIYGFGWGSTPNPAGGAYDDPPDPIKSNVWSNYRALGDRRKLSQRGLWRSPNRNRIWCTLAIKSGFWWQLFMKARLGHPVPRLLAVNACGASLAC